jgi:hypothetical protein
VFAAHWSCRYTRIKAALPTCADSGANIAGILSLSNFRVRAKSTADGDGGPMERRFRILEALPGFPFVGYTSFSDTPHF